jgi:UDP-N-acetylglucosamine 2-epimerase (non-hydrolysing)
MFCWNVKNKNTGPYAKREMVIQMKIALVAGARPNFMKVAPIFHALSEREKAAHISGIDLQVSVVHTGQHYDEGMSDVFFRDLRMPKPDKHLEVGSGSHAEQTAKIMIAFEKVILEDRPDLVVVVGDVNSTLACSLTAKKLGIKVAHVEAGLRSFDMSMPEEINRKITDAISDLLFVTEDSGLQNLRTEGIPEEKIYLVGNVMIDTLKHNLSIIEGKGFTPSTTVRNFRANMSKYAVLTLHRPSNVDCRENLEPIWGAITEVARQIPILFPVHPRTRSKLKDFGLKAEGVTIVEPIGYLDMLYAVKDAAMIFTDSGGLQEETTFLGVPCITIRENTERPITVDLGTNYLVGTRPEAILSTAEEILSGNANRGTIPPLWDGHSAERIVEILMRL